MNTTSELVVISKQELSDFGCPNCGSKHGSVFFTYNKTAYSWGCYECGEDLIIVESSISEVNDITFKNTLLVNMVGVHPWNPGHDSKLKDQILKSGIFIPPEFYTDQQVYHA